MKKKYKNKTGYLDGTPTANNPYNIIEGGDGFTPITMNGVSQPILANGVLLQPNSGNYIFPGNFVYETPVAQNGTQVGPPPEYFNQWYYNRPYQQVTPIDPGYTQPQPIQMQQPQGTTMQNPPQEYTPINQQQGGGANYAGWIQQGAQAVGDVLDTIGDIRRGVLKGGAAILNSLLPDNQPKRDFVPQITYNQDAYGRQQYNNIFQDGGQVKPISLKRAQQMYASGQIDRDRYLSIINNQPQQQAYQQSTYSPPVVPIKQEFQPGQYFVPSPTGGYTINTKQVIADRTANSGRIGADYDHYTNRSFAYEGLYGNKNYTSTFQFGGSLDGYQEVDLTPEQIDYYRSLGYDIQL